MADQELLVTGLKMVVALGVVLCIFAASIWVFRRFAGTSKSFLKKSGLAAKPIEVLASQNLGPGKSVYLLRCLDQKFFVGATNQGISCIAEIADENSESDELSFDSALLDRSGDRPSQKIKDQIKTDLREVSRV